MIGIVCALCLGGMSLIFLFGSPFTPEAQPSPQVARVPTLAPINGSQPNPLIPAETGEGAGQVPTTAGETNSQNTGEGEAVTSTEESTEAGDSGNSDTAAETTEQPPAEEATSEQPAAEAAPTAAPPEPAVIGGEARLVITRLDAVSEFVEIKNIGGGSQDLSGWQLVSENGGESCPLGGSLAANETLRVWAKTVDAAQGGYNCGQAADIWSDEGEDPAVLYDGGGNMIYRRK